MQKIPGPWCGWDLGLDWIDSQTLALTRMPAPAQRHSTPPAHNKHSGTSRHAPRRHHATPVVRVALSPVECDLRRALERAGVTDRDEQAMFLAQVAHESAGFTRLSENLHYSARRLHEVFPKKFSSEADAQAVLAQGEAAVAERIYGHRSNLGNTHDGDGGLYRGRGYIQLTGRANYEAAGTALGLDLVGHPELAEQPDVAARVAVWFWTRNARLRHAGQQADVEGATRIVNGGLNGLADRRTRFREYQHLLETAPSPLAPPQHLP